MTPSYIFQNIQKALNLLKVNYCRQGLTLTPSNPVQCRLNKRLFELYIKPLAKPSDASHDLQLKSPLPKSPPPQKTKLPLGSQRNRSVLLSALESYQ